jgi:hypothetical protein
MTSILDKTIWNRNLLQWISLIFVVLLFIVIVNTIDDNPIYNVMNGILIGINFSVWFYGGIFNEQNKLLDKSIDLNRKMINHNEIVLNKLMTKHRK